MFIFEMNPRLGWLSWCWSMVVVMDPCVTMVDYCALIVDYWLLLVTIGYYWLWTIVLLLCSHCGLLVTIGCALLWLLLGSLPLCFGLITPVVTIGYYWTSVPVSGTHHPV